MGLESEKVLQQIYDTIDYTYKSKNSFFNYNMFANLITENKNKKIEESEVYKLLICMLAREKTRFKERLPINTTLYRGRLVDIYDCNKFSVDKTNICGLDKYESKEPPLHISKDGRSNIAGASYLYVAKDKYTAVSECKPLRESYLSVAEFKTVKEMEIFNLCDDDTTEELQDFQKEKDYLVRQLVELVMRAFYNSAYNIENGYMVSQYISELVRKHGYDGIAYKSFISNGKNYAIFNCCESNIQFVNSEIVLVGALHFDIITINDGEIITNPNSFKLPLKEHIADFKRYLVDKISYLNEDHDDK